MSKSTIRNLIIGFLLFILAVATFSFTIYTIIQKGNHLSTLVATLEKQKTQDDSYLHLQRLAEDTTNEREELKKYFLQGEFDSIGFITEVEKVASQMGLSLKTDLKIISDANKVGWTEATFSFSGSRESVYSLIDILESLPYVLQLTSVNLEALSSTEWKASVTMQVQIL